MMTVAALLVGIAFGLAVGVFVLLAVIATQAEDVDAD